MSNDSFCIGTFASRGHTVRAVCESFHLSKDAGFKVVAHMMPDLPNVGMERDVEQFIVSILLNDILLLILTEKNSALRFSVRQRQEGCASCLC